MPAQFCRHVQHHKFRDLVTPASHPQWLQEACFPLAGGEGHPSQAVLHVPGHGHARHLWAAGLGGAEDRTDCSEGWNTMVMPSIYLGDTKLLKIKISHTRILGIAALIFCLPLSLRSSSLTTTDGPRIQPWKGKSSGHGHNLWYPAQLKGCGLFRLPEPCRAIWPLRPIGDMKIQKKFFKGLLTGTGIAF